MNPRLFIIFWSYCGNKVQVCLHQHLVFEQSMRFAGRQDTVGRELQRDQRSNALAIEALEQHLSLWMDLQTIYQSADREDSITASLCQALETTCGIFQMRLFGN